MKYLALSCFLLLALNVLAQYPYDSKRDNIWLFGYNDDTSAHPLFGVTQLKFDEDSFAISTVDSFADFAEDVAIACDTSGNLMFSTNGIWIYDRNFNRMLGGDTLNPGYFSESFANLGYPVPQGALILPLPGTTSVYYIFHVAISDIAQNPANEIDAMYYSVVDMNLNSPLGKVTSMRNLIQKNDVFDYGKVAACRHANGRDWWIIVFNNTLTRYKRILFDPNGVHDLGWVNDNLPPISTTGVGQAIFSADGTRYVLNSAVSASEGWYLLTASFDRCNGMFDSVTRFHFRDTCYAYGAEIDYTGRFAYISCERYLFQYEISKTPFDTVGQVVALWDGFVDPDFPLAATVFHLMANTPSQKIFIDGALSTKFLHVINAPDKLGTDCNVTQHSISLPTFNAASMPNYPNFRLGPVDGSACDTLGIDVGIAEPFKQAYSPQADLEVYPNPASNYCNVGFGSTLKQDGQLVVHNLSGQKVFVAPLQKATIGYTLKVEDWVSGLYLCTLYEGSTEKGSVRFVKE